MQSLEFDQVYDESTYSSRDLSLFKYILFSPHCNYNDFLPPILYTIISGLVSGSFITTVMLNTMLYTSCPQLQSLPVMILPSHYFCQLVLSEMRMNEQTGAKPSYGSQLVLCEIRWVFSTTYRTCSFHPCDIFGFPAIWGESAPGIMVLSCAWKI